MQPGQFRWTAVTTCVGALRHRARGSGTRNGRDGAVGIYLADTLIIAVSNVHGSVRSDGDSSRVVQLSLGGRLIVAVESAVIRRPGARHGGNDAVAVDTPDALVGGIGDVDAAVGANG